MLWVGTGEPKPIAFDACCPSIVATCLGRVCMSNAGSTWLAITCTLWAADTAGEREGEREREREREKGGERVVRSLTEDWHCHNNNSTNNTNNNNYPELDTLHLPRTPSEPTAVLVPLLFVEFETALNGGGWAKPHRG